MRDSVSGWLSLQYYLELSNNYQGPPIAASCSSDDETASDSQPLATASEHVARQQSTESGMFSRASSDLDAELSRDGYERPVRSPSSPSRRRLASDTAAAASEHLLAARRCSRSSTDGAGAGGGGGYLRPTFHGVNTPTAAGQQQLTAAHHGSASATSDSGDLWGSTESDNVFELHTVSTAQHRPAAETQRIYCA